MPDWAALLTEQQNPASERIDEVSTLEMLTIIKGVTNQFDCPRYVGKFFGNGDGNELVFAVDNGEHF